MPVIIGGGVGLVGGLIKTLSGNKQKKQGRKLPGQWTVEVTNEMFVLRAGKISSTNPDKFIEI